MTIVVADVTIYKGLSIVGTAKTIVRVWPFLKAVAIVGEVVTFVA